MHVHAEHPPVQALLRPIRPPQIASNRLVCARSGEALQPPPPPYKVLRGLKVRSPSRAAHSHAARARPTHHPDLTLRRRRSGRARRGGAGGRSCGRAGGPDGCPRAFLAPPGCCGAAAPAAGQQAPPGRERGPLCCTPLRLLFCVFAAPLGPESARMCFSVVGGLVRGWEGGSGLLGCLGVVGCAWVLRASATRATIIIFEGRSRVLYRASWLLVLI